MKKKIIKTLGLLALVAIAIITTVVTKDTDVALLFGLIIFIIIILDTSLD